MDENNSQTIYTAPTEERNFIDEWARSPDRGGKLKMNTPDDQAYVKKAIDGILSGQISDEGAENLAKRVKGIAPFVYNAVAERRRLSSMFSDVDTDKPVMYQPSGPMQDGSSMPAVDTGMKVKAMNPFLQSMRERMPEEKRYLVEAARNNPDIGQQLLEAELKGSSRGAYYTALPTERGYIPFDTRTGRQGEPLSEGGRPYIPPTANPTLQGAIAGARKTGEVKAGSKAQAEVDLPTAIIDAQTTNKQLDDLLSHPGLKQSIGPAGWLPKIPGTPQADFITRLEQLQGRQFLDAYQMLKGGGQITEVEGKKAQDAIARMGRAQSVGSFRQAVADYKTAVNTGIKKLQSKAGQEQTGIEPQQKRKTVKFSDLPSGSQ